MPGNYAGSAIWKYIAVNSHEIDMGKLIDLIGMRFGKLLVIEQAASTKEHSAQWLCRCDCGNSVIVRGRSLSLGKVTDCGCETTRFYDLTGMQFGKLTVIEKVNPQSDGVTRWKCRCECGNICIKRSISLRNGIAVDCGCSTTKFVDLTDKRFGKLTVIEKLPPQTDRRTRWMCQCDCGNTCVVTSQELRKGLQKSCGCGRRKDLAGKKFGSLTAIQRSDKYIEMPDRGKKYLWECQCDCGEIVYRLPEKLRDNVNSACDKCLAERKVKAMVENAGFVEGTQLNKIASNKPLSTSKSGVRGVFFNNRTGKWRAMLKFQGISHYLGEYKDISDAKKARALAEEKYFAPVLEQYDELIIENNN